MRQEVKFETLKGETLVGAAGLWKGSEETIFLTREGRIFKMFHERECCESVDIEDVAGDPTDLFDTPLLLAEEVSSHGDTDWGTATWTFYKLSTINGSVTIRWYGESNGYYSERVSFFELIDDEGY